MWPCTCNLKYKLWGSCISKNSLSTLLYEDTYQKKAKQDVWKQGRRSVCKQNRSTAKNKNMLSSLAAVNHKNTRNAAGNRVKAVHP